MIRPEPPPIFLAVMVTAENANSCRLAFRTAFINPALVASLRMTPIIAPMVLDGPNNSERFAAYAAQVLVPKLNPGDVVIIDNLSSHKWATLKDRIEAASATLSFLPPAARTSTLSRRPSRGSRPCSFRRASKPSAGCGT